MSQAQAEQLLCLRFDDDQINFCSVSIDDDDDDAVVATSSKQTTLTPYEPPPSPLKKFISRGNFSPKFVKHFSTAAANKFHTTNERTSRGLRDPGFATNRISGLPIIVV